MKILSLILMLVAFGLHAQEECERPSNPILQFAANSVLAVGPCGAGMTVDEGVADCARIPNSTKVVNNVTWKLVSRIKENGRLYEAWLDTETDLVWGDRLDSEYSLYEAAALKFPANADVREEEETGVWIGIPEAEVKKETACESEEGRLANGKIQDRKFGLPSTDEFFMAKEHGVASVVPNVGSYNNCQYYWSKNVYAIIIDREIGPQFDDIGKDVCLRGSSNMGYAPTDRSEKSSVRCVGRR